jgi:hypothetical protein
MAMFDVWWTAVLGVVVAQPLTRIDIMADKQKNFTNPADRLVISSHLELYCRSIS